MNKCFLVFLSASYKEFCNNLNVKEDSYEKKVNYVSESHLEYLTLRLNSG